MSHQGFTTTFKEFKEQFYSKIGDGSCFNVLDINLLKVVLDGLKIQYSLRGAVAHYFNKPTIFFYLYLLGKALFDFNRRRLLRKNIKASGDASTLIGFSASYLKENSKKYSLHFERFFNEFGSEKFCYVIEENNAEVNADFKLEYMPFGFNFLSLENIKLYSEIKKFTTRLKYKWTKKESIDIQIACFVFYINYLKWDFFFKYKKISRAIIQQHYHREGFMLACKRHGISVSELQHGLIAQEDIFYVMPHQVSEIVFKALFPDVIFVYGDYWKKILLKGCEFKEKQIVELGYYHYEGKLLESKEQTKVANLGERKIILITTQYSAENYFINYIKNLSLKLADDWEIILKPHPAEGMHIYKVLEDLHNVSIVQGNLDQLISRCEFLISIFSTTIFDAVRMKKPAFSLYFPIFSDYVNGIVLSGAACLLKFEDDPVEKYREISSADRVPLNNNFYSKFNKNACVNIFFKEK